MLANVMVPALTGVSEMPVNFRIENLGKTHDGAVVWNWYHLFINEQICVLEAGDGLCIHDVLGIIEAELSDNTFSPCEICGVMS